MIVPINYPINSGRRIIALLPVCALSRAIRQLRFTLNYFMTYPFN